MNVDKVKSLPLKESTYKSIIKLLVLLGFITIFCLSSSAAQAQVMINEVLPAPSTGPEWVELYNASNQAVNLEGWTLSDQLSTPSIIWQSTSQSIDPSQFLVIELNLAKLNNSADGVTLKDKGGAVIDQMSYASSQTDLSWSRLSATTAEYQLTTASPGQINLLPSPTPASSPSPPPASPTPSANQFIVSNIHLTEVMACPLTGENEWLEVENTHNFLVTLDDWQVTDQAGNSRTISLTLNPHSLGIISWSGSLLNNSGDTVKLVASNQETAFAIALTECVKGNSWIFESGSWRQTSTPTPGQTNLLTTEEETPTQTDSTTLSVAQTDRSTLAAVDNQPPSPSPTLFTPPLDPTGLVLSAATVASESTIGSAANTRPPSDWLYGQRLTQLKYPILSVILGGLVLVAVGLYLLSWVYDQELPSAAPSTAYLA